MCRKNGDVAFLLIFILFCEGALHLKGRENRDLALVFLLCASAALVSVFLMLFIKELYSSMPFVSAVSDWQFPSL
jgi:hypothetical protein